MLKHAEKLTLTENQLQKFGKNCQKCEKISTKYSVVSKTEDAAVVLINSDKD